MTETCQWRERGHKAGIVVIPLLFEVGAETGFDAVVCVACSPATQQDRWRQRGWSLDDLQRRIRSQWPIERKMTMAHYVIWNEGGLEVLERQSRMVLDRVGGCSASGAQLTFSEGRRGVGMEEARRRGRR
jgi:dephospho-CoA kinase